jgi:hypothetical protein
MVTFRPLYRRALIESRNNLSSKDYSILLDAYRRPNRHNERGEWVNLLVEVEKLVPKTGPLSSILTWLKENWFLVLKLILSLLPLFLAIDETQPY